MRTLAAGAAAITLLMAGAAAHDYDHSGYDDSGYDQDSYMHSFGPRDSYVPYGRLLWARVEDRRGHTVGRVEDVSMTPIGRVTRVNVRLMGPQDDGKVVSIPARDAYLVRTDAPLGADEVRSSLTYSQMEELPPPDNS